MLGFFLSTSRFMNLLLLFQLCKHLGKVKFTCNLQLLRVWVEFCKNFLTESFFLNVQKKYLHKHNLINNYERQIISGDSQPTSGVCCCIRPSALGLSLAAVLILLLISRSLW